MQRERREMTMPLTIPGNLSLLLLAIFLAFVWELFWKAIALWKSARNGQKYWYVAILLLNTLGILPIAYIYVFQKGEKKGI